MYGYNNEPLEEETSKNTKGNKILYLLLFIIIVVLLVIFLPKFLNNEKRYSEMENKLIEAAKAYVINNNIVTETEEYFDINTLNITIDSDCSKNSGVIFNGQDYLANLICDDYKSSVNKEVPEKTSNDIQYLLVPSSKTSDDVTIIISVTNKNFDHIELPNKEVSKENSISYKVNENGSYTFKIYDKSGNHEEKIIDVTNISFNNLGSCVAKWKSDHTDIAVKNNDGVTISTYEYIIDNKTEYISTSGEFQSKAIKPKNVLVKVKDSDGTSDKIKCSIDEKMETAIVTNEKGKNCLEGHICYIQYDYQDSKHPYCSMQPDTHPNSCGGIGRNGCSITAASMAIANMGVKSRNGEVYNPFTVHEELYNFNYDKSMGACWGGCSGWSKIKDSIISAGLSASKVTNLDSANYEEVYAHLRKGYPVILHAAKGSYAMSNGHYLTLLEVREDNLVYVSDPSNKNGTENEASRSPVDTWVSLSTLANGHVDNYMLVGPQGLF